LCRTRPAILSNYDRFGLSVSLLGDLVLIGAPHQLLDSGAAYVFRQQRGAWSQEAKLESDTPHTHDLFGSGVALQGDTAIVSAPHATWGGSVWGSVYQFDRDAVASATFRNDAGGTNRTG